MKLGFFLFHRYLDYKIDKQTVQVILNGYEVFVSLDVYKYSDKDGSHTFDSCEQFLSFPPFKSRFPFGYSNIMSSWTPSGED